MKRFDEITIDLFKAVVVDSKLSDSDWIWSERGIKNGVLVPNISSDVVDYAIAKYGINGGLFNATFHKSFERVATASMEQLFFEQMFHYLTTYGTAFTSSYVYIPAEELNIPELDADKIKLVVVQPITMEELNEKVKTMVGGIALAQDTVNKIVELWSDLNLKIDVVKNRELLIALCDRYGIVPNNADMFLRYLLYKTTNSTLKIKSREFLIVLKYTSSWNTSVIRDLLNKYIEENGYKPLARIYNRNKELFLCLKGDAVVNKHINKISKLAKNTQQLYFEDSLMNHIADINISLMRQNCLRLLIRLQFIRKLLL